MPADLCVACVAMAVAYEVRFHGYPKYIPGGEPPDPTHYALVTPVAALVVVVTFALMGVYRQGRGIQFIDDARNERGGELQLHQLGLFLMLHCLRLARGCDDDVPSMHGPLNDAPMAPLLHAADISFRLA